MLSVSLFMNIQDGIRSIRWELYSFVDFNLVRSGPGVNAQNAVFNSGNELSVEQVKKLQNLEYSLRSRNYHVYYGASHFGVWVFDLPKSSTTGSQREIENEELLHITASFETKSM